ncbi:MAG: SpoIIE family protein phosphatase, partial [Selenomonadaceae bacterium]|nr:SpoIIE family protein phosphatase [Selenomonadaceae bacterium]
RMIAGESGVMSIEVDGEVYYFAYAPMPSVGWSFGTVIEDDEVLDPVRQVTEDVREKMTAFREVLQQVFFDSMVKVVVVLIPVLLLVFYGSGTLAERVTRPIRKLAAGVKEIAGGNFDKKLAIDTGDEIEHLAVCFNAMTDSLKEHTRQLEQVAAEKEHVRTELEVAAKIQMGMLPGTFPAFPERKDFGIYAIMHPAKDVGGDFYDFYLLDEDHLVVTVADVSGKGIPAALFMAMSKTILRNCVMMAKQPEDLAAVLENANHQLCQNNESAMFVTVFLGVLDLRTGHFVYADAGHCPPLLGHGGSYGFLSMEKCCMLGLAELPYEQQSIDLSPGDTLFLYTDGVSEAMDGQRNQFTEQRIRETLDALPLEEAIEDILPEVLERIRQHAGDAEQSDDITMLGLRYYGSRC